MFGNRFSQPQQGQQQPPQNFQGFQPQGQQAPSGFNQPAQQPQQPAGFFGGQQSNQLGSIFQGIGAAKPRIDANYMRQGHYLVRINNCKLDRNRKQILFSAIEMSVVKVFDDCAGQGHRVGEDITWYIDQTKADYFLPEVRTFIANVSGAPFEQIGEAEAMDVYGQNQPFAGLVVEVKGRLTVTNNNRNFTRISFVREVPAAEALQQIDPQVVAHYWPNGALERVAQMQGQMAHTAQAPMQQPMQQTMQQPVQQPAPQQSQQPQPFGGGQQRPFFGSAR